MNLSVTPTSNQWPLIFVHRMDIVKKFNCLIVLSSRDLTMHTILFCNAKSARQEDATSILFI